MGKRARGRDPSSPQPRLLWWPLLGSLGHSLSHFAIALGLFIVSLWNLTGGVNFIDSVHLGVAFGEGASLPLASTRQQAPQVHYILPTGCFQLLRWGLMPTCSICAPFILFRLTEHLTLHLLFSSGSHDQLRSRIGHFFEEHWASSLFSAIADLSVNLSITDLVLYASKSMCLLLIHIICFALASLSLGIIKSYKAACHTAINLRKQLHPRRFLKTGAAPVVIVGAVLVVRQLLITEGHLVPEASRGHLRNAPLPPLDCGTSILCRLFHWFNYVTVHNYEADGVRSPTVVSASVPLADMFDAISRSIVGSQLWFLKNFNWANSFNSETSIVSSQFSPTKDLQFYGFTQMTDFISLSCTQVTGDFVQILQGSCAFSSFLQGLLVTTYYLTTKELVSTSILVKPTNPAEFNLGTDIKAPHMCTQVTDCNSDNAAAGMDYTTPTTSPILGPSTSILSESTNPAEPKLGTVIEAPHMDSNSDNAEAGMDYTTPTTSPTLVPKLSPPQQPSRGWGLLGGGDNSNSSDDSDDENIDKQQEEQDVSWSFGTGSSPIKLGQDALLMLGKIMNRDFSGPPNNDRHSINGQEDKTRANYSTILNKIASLVMNLCSAATLAAAKTFSLPQDSRDHDALDNNIKKLPKILKIVCNSDKAVDTQVLFGALNSIGIELLSTQNTSQIRTSRGKAHCHHQQHIIMVKNNTHLSQLLRGITRLEVDGSLLHVHIFGGADGPLHEIPLSRMSQRRDDSEDRPDPRFILLASLNALQVPLPIIVDIITFLLAAAGIQVLSIRINNMTLGMHPKKNTKTLWTSVDIFDENATWVLQFVDMDDYNKAMSMLSTADGLNVRFLPDLSFLAAPTGGSSIKPDTKLRFPPSDAQLRAYQRTSPRPLKRSHNGSPRSRVPPDEPFKTVWLHWEPERNTSGNNARDNDSDLFAHYYQMLQYVGFLFFMSRNDKQLFAARLTVALRDLLQCPKLEIRKLSFLDDPRCSFQGMATLNGIQIHFSSHDEAKTFVQTCKDQGSNLIFSLALSLGEPLDESIVNALTDKFNMGIHANLIVDLPRLGPSGSPSSSFDAPPLSSALVTSKSAHVSAGETPAAKGTSFSEVVQRDSGQKGKKSAKAAAPTKANASSDSVLMPPPAPIPDANGYTSYKGKGPAKPDNPPSQPSRQTGGHGGSSSKDLQVLPKPKISHENAPKNHDQAMVTTDKQAATLQNMLTATLKTALSSINDSLSTLAARADKSDKDVQQLSEWQENYRGHTDAEIARMRVETSSLNDSIKRQITNQEQYSLDIKELKEMVAAAMPRRGVRSRTPAPAISHLASHDQTSPHVLPDESQPGTGSSTSPATGGDHSSPQ